MKKRREEEGGKRKKTNLERDYFIIRIDKIKKNMNADRTIDIQRVRDAGYDIKIEAKKLQDFYLSKIRKG